MTSVVDSPISIPTLKYYSNPGRVIPLFLLITDLKINIQPNSIQ